MFEKKTSKTIYFFSLLFFIFSLILLDKKGWFDWLKSPLEAFFNPIRLKFYQQKVNAKLQNQCVSNKILELEKTDLEAKNKLLEEENSKLREMLGSRPATNWSYQPSGVIFCQNHLMILNQGKEQGIRKGQAVVFKNMLVGKIVEVNSQTSRVKLISAKDNQIRVRLDNLAGAKGVVKVGSQPQFFLEEVDFNVKLEKGQIVISSGEDEDFPSGLLIGKIEEVLKNEADIYQKALIKPFLDFNDLTQVFVILNWP